MASRTLTSSLTTNQPNLTPSGRTVLQRKCACGNHTVRGSECAACAKRKTGIQRKLTIGASNDPLEQEADRVADQVMAAPASADVDRAPPHVQRFTGQTASHTDVAPPSEDRVLANTGRPLDSPLRQDMEQRFGYDFGEVRVHTDELAAESARALEANAYTVGRHIVFGHSQYNAQISHVGRVRSASMSPLQPMWLCLGGYLATRRMWIRARSNQRK